MSDDEGALRQSMQAWKAAVHARDLDALMDLYSPDIVQFDVLDPLRVQGREAVRARAGGWFGNFAGPIGCDTVEEAFAVSGDVGWCHCLNHISGDTHTNGRLDMWVRVTVCYRKLDGRWLATHEHVSVPFNGETGQASVALKP